MVSSGFVESAVMQQGIFDVQCTDKRSDLGSEFFFARFTAKITLTPGRGFIATPFKRIDPSIAVRMNSLRSPLTGGQSNFRDTACEKKR